MAATVIIAAMVITPIVLLVVDLVRREGRRKRATIDGQ